jgi:hypothetical protein
MCFNIMNFVHIYIYKTMTNRLMLFSEILAVYCENHMEHTNIYIYI